MDPHLADVFPGSGGGAAAANCKLQAGYECKHGELDFFKVDPGTRPDNPYSPLLPLFLQDGDLVLFDQGSLYPLPEDIYRVQVIAGGRGGTPEVRGRLICLRVSEKVASERRRKVLKEAHKKCRTPISTRFAL